MHKTLFMALALASVSFSLSLPRSVAAKQARAHIAATKPQTTNSPAMLDAWLNRADLKNSRIAVELMSLPAGKTVFEHAGNRRATPASTTKVLTTACAYELLGPSYQFPTRLAYEGTISNGVLHGDLLLMPSQDPTLTREQLRKLFKDGLDNQGNRITRVEGKVLMVMPPEGREHYQMSWLAEDFGQEWMPVSSSLVLDKNMVFASQIPRHLHVKDEMAANNAMLDNVLSSGLAASFASLNPETNTVSVYRGGVIGKSGQVEERVKKDGPFVVANPDNFGLAVVQQIMSDEKVTHNGVQVSFKAIPDGGSAKQLAECLSRPLSQIIKVCLYESDNLYAQQLLRAIGNLNQSTVDNAKRRAASGITLEEKGLFRLGTWLTSIGVPAKEVILFDGCGLSRKNSLTPHALNTVLKHMAGPNIDGPYLALLRTQGDTAYYRFKTGAMDTVRGISGVLKNNQGHYYALSILVNGHTPSVKDVRIALSDLIERVRHTDLK